MDDNEISQFVRQIERAYRDNEQVKETIEILKDDEYKMDLQYKILQLDNQRLQNILHENLETFSQSIIINNIDTIDTLPDVLKEFVWLKTIKINNTSINHVKNIPETVKILYIYNNDKLTIIDEKSEFPIGLERLSLNSNSLTSVDFKYLPPNIDWLNLSTNHISIIKNTYLLTKLEILQLQENRLQELPRISDTIQKMDISCNQIKTIDWLPYSLTELDCSNNRLDKLFDCPPYLYKIFAYKNNITQITKLPDTVTNLDLSQNKINILENLPTKLFELDMNDNQIRDFNIENIPTTLRILDISDNLMIGANIKQKLKSLKFIVNLVSDYKENHMDTSNDGDNDGDNDKDNEKDDINDIISNFNDFNPFNNFDQANSWLPNINHNMNQQQNQPNYTPRIMAKHDGIIRV
jgi:hypothetical protein